MKITKKQLKKIIKEEKARLHEGRMKEMEMQLVDEIVDLLVERGAVKSSGDPGYDGVLYEDDVYQNALDYLQGAIIPTLQSLAEA